MHPPASRQPDSHEVPRFTIRPPLANGPVLNGPVLNGPVLNGPVLNGPVLNGPVVNTLAAAPGRIW
jgi:hypothetical protein